MVDQVVEVTRPRPYFLPASIDFDTLPEAVKVAFDTIIQPTYEELVLSPRSGLERAAGMTIVFLLVEELIDQFDLGQDFDLLKATTSGDRKARNKSLMRHFRLVSAKQIAINALLRIRMFSPPQVFPMGPQFVLSGTENGKTQFR